MNKGIKKYFLPLLLIFALSACNLQLVEGSQGEDTDLLLTITAQAQLLEQGGLTFTPIAAQNQAIVFITATADGAASATPEAVIPAAVLPPATGPVTVTVSIATITPSGPTALCPGDSVTLTSSSATGNTWSTGATTQSITVSTAGSYWVRWFDGSCTSDTSALVNVITNSQPTTPTITPSGPTAFCSGDSVILTSSSPSGNVWSTGATTQSITVFGAGD